MILWKRAMFHYLLKAVSKTSFFIYRLDSNVAHLTWIGFPTHSVLARLYLPRLRVLRQHTYSSCNKADYQGSISPTFLRAAFTPVAPQSVRTQSSRQYLFTLLVSTCVKAVRRMLMKLSPGLDFTNILCSAFMPVASESKKRQPTWLYFLRFWDLLT